MQLVTESSECGGKVDSRVNVTGTYIRLPSQHAYVTIGILIMRRYNRNSVSQMATNFDA